MTRTVRDYFINEDGFNAAEFAMVMPLVVTFVFGFIHLCLMMYSSSRLHWAVEEAARCASVRSDCKTADVADSVKIQTWATDHYSGLAPAAFAYSATGICSQTAGAADGHQVTGTATYQLSAILVNKAFPLAATACFP